MPLLLLISLSAASPGAELTRPGAATNNEPPSRPSVDWSRQRPHFAPDMARELAVELGRTAYLTCKVLELGDKTVSWLRPRENQILTVGKFTYIGDPRFAPINNNGSQDWLLEIKDVGPSDSTSYECQVSTDPKMSAIINLHVKAGKSRIKQGEHYSASVGANIEFSCEILQSIGANTRATHQLPTTLLGASNQPNSVQQIYWYHNGNLINYAKTSGHSSLSRMNFSLEFDQQRQSSRLKLFNIQLNEAGNYTCKPTSAEPSTIRLRVKRPSRNSSDNRANYGNEGGSHLMSSSGVALRNRQQYGIDSMESTNRGLKLASSICLLLISFMVSCNIYLMRHPTLVIDYSLPNHNS